ncbi:MAG: response regulator [Pseudomonadota bacterium]
MTDQLRRVFIVEDEIMVAFEMVDLLEDLGFEVVGPSIHLSEATDIAETKEFDIAFLDVNLGSGKTSQPVARMLKERGIPFVYITAYDRDQVDFVEPDDIVLKKPISGDMLAETLADANIRNSSGN